jgi:hypothetical protein
MRAVKDRVVDYLGKRYRISRDVVYVRLADTATRAGGWRRLSKDSPTAAAILALTVSRRRIKNG